MKKYIYRAFHTRDGEREYYHKGVHVIDQDQDTKEFVYELCMNFWSDRGDEEKECSWWFMGEIITSVYDYKEITKEEYNILNRFL